MMKRFMLSCYAATELMEKKHRGKLSFGEKMQLFLHTAMCDACSRYEKQSQLLERLFKAKQEAPTAAANIDEEAKDLEKKILEQLKDA
jgi:hypothetical protein